MARIPHGASEWLRAVGIAALVGPVLLPTCLLIGAIVGALVAGGSVPLGLGVGVVLTLGVGLLVACELDWHAIPVAWAGALAGSVVFATGIAASEALLPVVSDVPFVDTVRAIVRMYAGVAFGGGFGATIALGFAVRHGWVQVTRAAAVVALLAFPGAILAARLAPWPSSSAEGFITLLLGLVVGLIPAIAIEVHLARRSRPAVS